MRPQNFYRPLAVADERRAMHGGEGLRFERGEARENRLGLRGMGKIIGEGAFLGFNKHLLEAPDDTEAVCGSTSPV